MSRRVLSVGQCGFDHGNLSQYFQQQFDASVVAADDTDEALELLAAGGFDLVLVNRVYDLDGSPGLPLIRSITGDEQLSGTPVMLVSNYEDAQQSAIKAGALPGFGKAQLTQTDVVERLRAVFESP